MSYNEKAAQRVQRVLAGRKDLVAKKMMGGICFMVSGNMCCGISGSALMVRVGRHAYEGMLAEEHVRPLEFGGRRPSGFVLIDPAGYRSSAALAKWIQRGVDFALTLPSKQVAERKPTPKRAGSSKK